MMLVVISIKRGKNKNENIIIFNHYKNYILFIESALVPDFVILCTWSQYHQSCTIIFINVNHVDIVHPDKNVKLGHLLLLQKMNLTMAANQDFISINSNYKSIDIPNIIQDDIFIVFVNIFFLTNTNISGSL